MKNIVIVPACTDLNRGDQALVWEAAYLVNDALSGNTSISIVDYGMDAEDRNRQTQQTRKEGFNVIRNIIENPKRVIRNKSDDVHASNADFLIAGCRAVFDFIKHFLLLFFPRKKFFSFLFKDRELVKAFEVLLNADVYVIKGGGFIHTYGKIGELYYLWFGLYYVLLAKQLGIRVIMLPNSIGPITGLSNRLFLKYVLNKIDLLYVREKISYEAIKEIGIKNVRFGFDLGYFAKKYDEIHHPHVLSLLDKIDHSTKNVGITVRPYRFPKSNDPEGQYEMYINSISKFCNRYNNYTYYFIVQVQGPSAHETDLIAINDIVSRLQGVRYRVIDINMNYRELLFIYEKMDCLIGTRFHSVIFSQIVGTPAIAIAYGGNKTRGIMRGLDLEEYVVDIENLSLGKIQTAFEILEKNKNKYSEKILKSKLLIDKDRQSMIAEVKKMVLFS